MHEFSPSLKCIFLRYMVNGGIVASLFKLNVLVKVRTQQKPQSKATLLIGVRGETADRVD